LCLCLLCLGPALAVAVNYKHLIGFFLQVTANMYKPSSLKQLRIFLYIHKASGHKQEDVQCAELNNTRWQVYRQQRVKLEVQYLLLTRKNPDCAERFHQNSLSKPISFFNTSRPTKVIVHGYRAQDMNIVVVDWIYGASFAYNLVVENYKEVALQISVLINQLQKHGCKLESFHFIGVSLGAHVAGFVGTLFEGKIGRITGLDPAGPMFKGADTYDRLDPTDALFVEAIHTDSDCESTFTHCHADAFTVGLSLQEKSGITTSPIPEQQNVFLLTTSSSPFCGKG
ncbi:hypothetical protein XENOCAPTIV_014506, partial [Xenoophorus captivus]